MAEAASGPEGAQDEVSTGEELKRKFREALERKRAREAGTGGSQRGSDTGKVHGVRGPARSRRSFRRKSG